MGQIDVGKAYDEIADVWNNDAFDRLNGVKQHEHALEFCGARRHALDVGCGSSGRIVELLLRAGFDVEGVDLSRRMIELAARRHPQVTFHHADICDWPFPRHYDLISAWDSVWHVPLAEHEKVLRRMLGHLTPGGVCIFTMGGLDQAAEKSDSVMGPEMPYSTLGIPRTLELVTRADCVCRHLEYDQHPEQHVYLIVQRHHKAAE
jgi:trans-aconitate methyltransferase